MRKKFILTLCILLSISLFACSKPAEVENNNPLFHFEKSDFKNVGRKAETPWYDHYRIVVHALGGIEGKYDYTNTYEALVENYNKGSRVFETDFGYTSDGEIVLLHEWAQYHDEFGLGEMTGWDAESLEYFTSHRIYDAYTPMTLNNLLEIMENIPDLYIVMDSKTFDADSCKEFYERFVEEVKQVDEKLLKRFIPQAYSAETYDIISGTYEYPDVILTLYAMYAASDGWQIYEIVSNKKIRTVVMHMNDDWGKKVIRDIHEYAKYGEWTNDDFRIYIHTVNDADVARSIVYDEGFYGIYSDYISEPDFQNDILK